MYVRVVLFLFLCTLQGRASVAPTLDLFITLLSMGSKGYRDLCVKRKVCVCVCVFNELHEW